MASKGQAVEMIKLKPKPGAEARLMEIRDELVAGYADLDGFIECNLIAAEDGHWYDVWMWETRANAEVALASKPPIFEEWEKLIDLVSFEWAEVTAAHN